MVRRRLFRLDRVSFGEAFRWARMVERREGPAAAALACDIMYTSDGNGTAIFFGHLFVVVTFQCQRKAPIKLYQA